MKICWFIIITVEQKNPRDHKGETPLHLAAKKGHFYVCQLMVKHLNNLYPMNEYEYEYECISHIVALSLLSTSCSKKQKVIDVMSTRRGKTALG